MVFLVVDRFRGFLNCFDLGFQHMYSLIYLRTMVSYQIILEISPILEYGTFGQMKLRIFYLAGHFKTEKILFGKRIIKNLLHQKQRVNIQHLRPRRVQDLVDL